MRGRGKRDTANIAALALTVFAPLIVPKVNPLEADPFFAVIALNRDIRPPPRCTAKVTVTPCRLVPAADFTLTTRGLDSAVFTTPV